MLKLSLALSTVAGIGHAAYQEYTSRTSYNGHGGVEIDNDITAPTGLSVPDCEKRCDDDSKCDCVSYSRSNKKCWKRASCDPPRFGIDGNFNTYVKTGSPTPPPSRLGSFLVIGDWGHDAHVHGNILSANCQKTVGNTMDAEMTKLGDVKFIVNVGDSFYPHGVRSKDDPQWDAKWRNFYSEQLRSVPWYSVMGNHDYHFDPAACSDTVLDGAQINGNISDLNTFYMPDYNWYLEHPELQLEVIAMDTNNYQEGWNHGIPARQQSFADCQHTACKSACYARLKARSEQAFKLFKERSAASSAKKLLVFSHYPTDYFWDTRAGDASSDFIAGLKTDKHHIEYFGGHRHNVDQSTTLSIAPNNNWLSGGGGGWACDGTQQGFVVGEIASDGNVTTRPVLVPQNECCNKFYMNASFAEVVYI